MVLVFNCLCELIKFEINSEMDPEGAVAADWEFVRTEIANTLTAIANQEAADLIDKEATEEEKIIHGKKNSSPMLRLFQNGTRNLKALA